MKRVLHLYSGRFSKKTYTQHQHAAARGKKEGDAAFAARAAQQAVATPHVSTNALGASLYAIRVVAAHTGNVDDGLIKERNWQLEHLRHIIKRLE